MEDPLPGTRSRLGAPVRGSRSCADAAATLRPSVEWQARGVSVCRRKAGRVRRSAGGEGSADAAGQRGSGERSTMTDKDVRGWNDDGFHAGGMSGGCTAVTMDDFQVRGECPQPRGAGAGE